jgi:hypothetical protein
MEKESYATERERELAAKVKELTGSTSKLRVAVEELSLDLDYAYRLLDKDLPKFIRDIEAGITSIQEAYAACHHYDTDCLRQLPYSPRGKVQIAVSLIQVVKGYIDARNIPTVWLALSRRDSTILRMVKITEDDLGIYGV